MINVSPIGFSGGLAVMKPGQNGSKQDNKQFANAVSMLLTQAGNEGLTVMRQDVSLPGAPGRPNLDMAVFLTDDDIQQYKASTRNGSNRTSKTGYNNNGMDQFVRRAQEEFVSDRIVKHDYPVLKPSTLLDLIRNGFDLGAQSYLYN